MKSRDQFIYDRIGTSLVQFAPKNAIKVIYKFTVEAEATTSEGAVYGWEYDYVDQLGIVGWFTVDSQHVRDSLIDDCRELRNFFVSQGQPAWKQCEFSVDVKTGKFSVDFKYD